MDLAFISARDMRNPQRWYILIGVMLATCGLGTCLAADTPIPQELIDAIKSLKGADPARRQSVYDLLEIKGDARLIPALKAYRDGSLQVREGRLVRYADRIAIPGRGSVLPLVDAISGNAILGGDGQPIYVSRPDLSQAISAPPRLEKRTVNDLIDTLALLDPDPIVRLASIRDAGAKAVRALPDPADELRYLNALASTATLLKASLIHNSQASDASEIRAILDAIDKAEGEHASTMTIASPTPSRDSTNKIQSALVYAQSTQKADPALANAITDALAATSAYQGRLDLRQKALDELPKTAAAIKRQLRDAPPRFVPALQQAMASFDLVLGTRPAQLAAVTALGNSGTGDAASLLRRALDDAQFNHDRELRDACAKALNSAQRYQTEVRLIEYTFAGLSLGSILVLLALGLSIIFGLMGVINMAHGEFMMVGAFTTYVVSESFKHLPPAYYDYYLIAAIPAAFLVAGTIGFACEWLIIRHLYGRPLETLLATWGVGLVLVQAVRVIFGDNLSVKPPGWMEGGWEVMPDLVLARNRLYIVAYCAICIAAVYFIVNRTKLGLLLRATTQNRQMASALGVPTRRVDALTFAFGAGLAGLAGVAVPLYNKINPGIGSEYIVDSFMVVVVGGVGTLAGAIFAGLGLGFLAKYLEPLLASSSAFSSSSSVIGKVLVMFAVVLFLQWRPQGLFPPKGRLADA